MKPEFVDNRDGNTLARAFGEWVGAVDAAEACIATAFFSPAGFRAMRAPLEKLPKIRLLIGAERPPESERPRRRPGDPGEPGFTRRQVAAALKRLEDGLRQERNLDAFTAMAQAGARKMVAFLGGDCVEVRRYKQDFLHAKAYLLLGPQEGLLAGSSNFTEPGVATNLEINIGRHGDEVVERGRRWFEELWAEAEPFDLAAVYGATFADWTPFDVFLLALWRLFGNEIEEEEKSSDARFQLTQFQKHGVWRALRLIEQLGGALVADEVGLGKTFIAGEIIQRYIDRRQRVLLVCPAALRDGTWAKFRAKYQIGVECVSIEELALDPQLGGRGAATLAMPIADYQLIVVDEAHNYRNPDSPQRAGTLRNLLAGKPKDLLLLTATPVNNSLWDLFHLLRLYVKEDAAFAGRGILSLQQRFTHAMEVDPFNLSPDVLFPVIDATTVKRTREFVKKHYVGEKIVGPSGQLQTIVFPRPRAITVRYQLDRALPGLFDKVGEALDPDDGQLSFFRYNAHAFLKQKDDEAVARDLAAEGLVRSGLLKRFESSIYAFTRTLERLERQHSAFLESMDNGLVPTPEFFDELEDETNISELIDAGTGLEPLTRFKAPQLRAAIEADQDVLKNLTGVLRQVKPVNDPKLAALRSELLKIIELADKEAADAEQARQNRKVLIFTSYHDTAEYIWTWLNDILRTDRALAAYKGRLAAATGGVTFASMSRDQAVAHFAPVSTEQPGKTADLYDILVATDVLAEGLNLQQARHIINFDMPWNPMRLVQRHGRIDRIGSAHDEVFLRTVFPDDRLNDLLDLEDRILQKLARAAASIGVGTAPVAGARRGRQVFAETREEIEAIYGENAELYEHGGTRSGGQTGEEYRQLLRKARERDPDRLPGMPWNIGSGLVKGRDQGVFFCASVGDRTYTRFLRTDAAWSTLPGEDAMISELGTCLRLIECTEASPRYVPPPVEEAVFGLWEKARDHIFEAWTAETDPASLQPKVPLTNKRVAEFLRANRPADIEDAEFIRLLDVVEQKWQPRDERDLRRHFVDESDSGTAKAARLIRYIQGTGIAPFRAPEPLPPIEADEIHLVCWMAVTAEEGKWTTNRKRPEAGRQRERTSTRMSASPMQAPFSPSSAPWKS
ncbi:MAG: helicase-related protein [Reyranella sp.]